MKIPKKISTPILKLWIVFLVTLTGCATTTVENPPSAAGATPSSKPATPDEVSPFFESNQEEPDYLDEEEATAQTVEEVIGQEAEKEINKPIGPQFDIPIVVNERVEKWINYFQTRGRKVFATWLSRSEKYIPMMKKILRENGLPEDLVYLAMIESGFKPYAYSRAKASGPWQFIKGTGRRYGLRVTWWVDERRDPEKSSIAAAQHLKDLYDQFNSWDLAAAGYNAGSGKIERAIEKYNTEDFWELSKKQHKYLKPETKDYVPKMIAAALMAKEPEKYGFTNITYENPIGYDKVLVPEPVQLDHVAKALNASLADLVELNPELRRNITPPDMPNYELKVPKGSRENFAAQYPEIRRNRASMILRHVVERGDTLQKISSAYGVPSSTILSFNHIKRIKRGMQLAVPLGSVPNEKLVKNTPKETVVAAPLHGSKYTVQEGDSLWSISRQFGVTVSQIRSWNRLDPEDNIYPGQRLTIQTRSKEASPQTFKKTDRSQKVQRWKSHRVSNGDTLSKIAKKYRVKVSELQNWNQLSKKSPILAGSVVRVRSRSM